jgi:hypothetical protein
VMPRQLEHIRDTWVQAVRGSQLPGMDRTLRSLRYQEALQREDAIEYPVDGDPLHGRVVARTPLAEQVEKGRARWDMRPGLLAGPASRPTKYGGRYNIIPLRGNGGVKFRTVSSRSPAGSWIHPGFSPLHIVDSVVAAVREDIAEDVLRAIAEGSRR